MPGIIVSRPIFNTLFKLAHDEGLSINAFLTRLLEKAGTDDVAQAVNGRVTQVEPTSLPAADSTNDVPVAGSITGERREPSTSPQRQPEPPAISSNTGGFESRAPHVEAPQTGVGVDDSGDPLPGRRIGSTVWDKVVSMEGHRFATSRGKKFSYEVTGEYIIVRESQARIPRSQFDKAQKMWPVSGPSRLVGVYAPSVVWAVMKELNEAEEPATV